jgi:hypothetical protein
VNPLGETDWKSPVCRSLGFAFGERELRFEPECCRGSGHGLFGQVLEEEVGHDVAGFDGFGESGVVPEGVGKGVEDDEAGVDAGAEIGTVEVGGAAEQGVAFAGDEEGGREAVQVSVDGGEDRVFGVGFAA